MQPCPWCVLQRVIFLAIAGVALIDAVGRTGSVLTAVRGLLSLSGVAAAGWQHTVASASASCALTWPDRFLAFLQLDALWPDLFQPRASCLEAKAWILGIPYEFYSAALFIALAAGSLRTLNRDRHSAHRPAGVLAGLRARSRAAEP